MASKQVQGKRRTRSKNETPIHTEAGTAGRDDSAAEARWRRTAEAAFYRAEARGFAPGRELDDWLEAERELDALEAARRGEPATDDRAGSAASNPAGPDSTPRKRAASKRSKTTRGAPMQARKRGDES